MMVGNNLKDTQLQQIVDKTILLYDKVFFTSCLSNILFKKNIPNILFQGKIFFYIVI